MRRLRALALALAGLAALPAPAQDLPLGLPAQAILTVDQERLFAASAWGRRVAAETEAAAQALAAENRRLEAELSAEEQALTERRGTIPAEEFRAAADAFDAKAVDIRRNQDAKERDLLRGREAERQRFFATALPVMGQEMQDRGAVAILDRRSVFLAVDALDITDELIAAIDAQLGDGAAAAPEPAPPPAPQTP